MSPRAISRATAKLANPPFHTTVAVHRGAARPGPEAWGTRSLGLSERVARFLTCALAVALIGSHVRAQQPGTSGAPVERIDGAWPSNDELEPGVVELELTPIQDPPAPAPGVTSYAISADGKHALWLEDRGFG